MSYFVGSLWWNSIKIKYDQNRISHGGLRKTPTYTLENHCTRTARSSLGGCSRRVHKIVYLVVKKGNILVNFLLLKIFIANYYHF